MMFGDLLSSRAIQVGLVFFVLVVSGSLLYSWHVQRNTAAEWSRTPLAVESLENEKETSTAPVVLETPDVRDTPEANEDTQPMFDETAAVPNETENLDITDAFLPDDFVSEEVPPEDVPVSPYGFGPYPEVPEAFIQKVGVPPWFNVDPPPGYEGKVYDLPENAKRGVEIIYRVLIGLWKQGDESIISGIHDSTTGLVYPFYDNTIYIRRIVPRDSKDGKATGIEVFSPPSLMLSAEEMQRLQDGGEPPAGIRVLDYDTEGIDPSQFLNIR